MLRRLGRPALVWWLLAALVAAGVAVSAGRVGGVNFNKAASCVGYGYGQTAPRIDVSLSTRPIVAGSTTSAFGSLSQNGCPVSGGSVLVQTRRVVSGSPVGNWVTVVQATTNSQGLFFASFTRPYNVLVRAASPTGSGYVVSDIVPLLVRTRLTLSVSHLSGCRLAFAGTPYPAKPNRPIGIARRNDNGTFTTLFSTTSDSAGHYYVWKQLNCGVSYNLASLIRADSINLGAYSPVRTATPSH